MRKALVLTAVVLAALAASAAAHAEPVFVVKGRGWGHGIGMSQYGAHGFARQGWGYERILLHYYRGTRLGRAEPREVRVLLGAGRRTFVVSSPRPFRVEDARGRKATLPAGRVGLGPKLVVKIRRKPVRLASPVRFAGGSAPVALDGKPYRGALVVRSRGGRMSAVNHVSLERYLGGVVPYEMPHSWHPEALKAQAVVARSYALATLKPRKLFDVFDDQRSQVYGGVRAETPETNRAVGATAGRVLFHGDAIAATFYHSTSGGRTAAIRDVWPKAEALPYLRAVEDPHDRTSPHHTWGPLTLTRAQLAARLKVPALRRARDVVVTRNGSGRAQQVRVVTPAGTRTVDAADFRVALELRSTWFRIGVLDLSAPSRKGVYGRPLELRGIARELRSPVIQRRDAGGWRQVARVRPRADGTFVVAVKPQPGAAFRVAAERVAGPEVSVAVAPQVRLAAVGGAVRGSVRPPLPRTTAEIQRKTAAGWRTVAAARVGPTGSFAPAAELPDGDYRAFVEPGGAFAPAASAPVRLRSE
ncbi:MAG TPA: SpoIID/LytB domain-containing protein [Gaiellaceae bacterium]|nr:SpoIID/LytB domain-containing protein [Gaiellaceae bacterium]